MIPPMRMPPDADAGPFVRLNAAVIRRERRARVIRHAAQIVGLALLALAVGWIAAAALQTVAQAGELAAEAVARGRW